MVVYERLWHFSEFNPYLLSSTQFHVSKIFGRWCYILWSGRLRKGYIFKVGTMVACVMPGWRSSFLMFNHIIWYGSDPTPFTRGYQDGSKGCGFDYPSPFQLPWWWHRAILVCSITRPCVNAKTVTSVNQTSISLMASSEMNHVPHLQTGKVVPLDETSTSGVSRMESEESTNL